MPFITISVFWKLLSRRSTTHFVRSMERFDFDDGIQVICTEIETRSQHPYVIAVYAKQLETLDGFCDLMRERYPLTFVMHKPRDAGLIGQGDVNIMRLLPVEQTIGRPDLCVYFSEQYPESFMENRFYKDWADTLDMIVELNGTSDARHGILQGR